MVQLRNGKQVNEVKAHSNKAVSTKKRVASATKRKASEISEVDKDNKGGKESENIQFSNKSPKHNVPAKSQTPTTPEVGIDSAKKEKVSNKTSIEDEQPRTPKANQLPAKEEKAKTTRNEKTPGRIAPIKKEDFSTSPDIKPFKGPPGKKVRKTAEEKDEEYTQFMRDNEGHVFHKLQICYDKGPNGSPTYDRQGFELDWEKVAHWKEPSRKWKPSKRENDHFDQKKLEEKRMTEIFFEPGAVPEDSWCFHNFGLH